MDATARKFLRASRQRLSAGSYLLNANYYLDAVYLAGYAIECAMKALLIEALPSKDRTEFVKSEWFRTGRGHNLEALAARLHRSGRRMPRQVAQSYSRTITWTTRLRYEVGLMPRKDALAFFQAAASVLEWVERSV